MGFAAETVVLPSRRDLVAACPRLASDCMERLAEGVYRHHRLGLVLVFLDECNREVGLAALAGEIAERNRQDAARFAVARRPRSMQDVRP